MIGGRLLFVDHLIRVISIQAFLRDLIQQHHKEVSPSKLDEYTDAMVILLITAQTNRYLHILQP